MSGHRVFKDWPVRCPPARRFDDVGTFVGRFDAVAGVHGNISGFGGDVSHAGDPRRGGKFRRDRHEEELCTQGISTLCRELGRSEGHEQVLAQ